MIFLIFWLYVICLLCASMALVCVSVNIFGASHRNGHSLRKAEVTSQNEIANDISKRNENNSALFFVVRVFRQFCEVRAHTQTLNVVVRGMHKDEISKATERHRQINKHKSHWPKRLSECVISITH